MEKMPGEYLNYSRPQVNPSNHPLHPVPSSAIRVHKFNTSKTHRKEGTQHVSSDYLFYLASQPYPFPSNSIHFHPSTHATPNWYLQPQFLPLSLPLPLPLILLPYFLLDPAFLNLLVPF